MLGFSLAHDNNIYPILFRMRLVSNMLPASSARHHLTVPLGHRFLASLQNFCYSPRPHQTFLQLLSVPVPVSSFGRGRSSAIRIRRIFTVENVKVEIYRDVADSAVPSLSHHPRVITTTRKHFFFSPSTLIARIKAPSPSQCSSAQQQYHTFFQCLTDSSTSTNL